MKNLLLIIALFFIIPSSMQGNFIDNKKESTIVISDDLMICNSSFKHKFDAWGIRSAKPLKVGENEHYFVPFPGMSVKVIITKY